MSRIKLFAALCCIIIINTSFYIKLPVTGYKIVVKLHSFRGVKISDPDNNEDLYGKLYAKLTREDVTPATGACSGTQTFWDKKGLDYESGPTGVTKVYPGIPALINKEISMGVWGNSSNAGMCDFANFFSEAVFKKLRIHAWGDMNDKEFHNPKYICKECNGSPRVIRLEPYFTQVAGLANGSSKTLKMGDDNYFELNYYENGDINGPHIKVLWSITVTKISY